MGLTQLAGGSLAYLALAVGGVFPIDPSGTLHNTARAIVTLLSVSFVAVCGISHRSIGIAISFVLVGLILLLPGLFNSLALEYGLYKLEGAIFGSALAYLVSQSVVERYGLVGLLRGFQGAGLLVLLVTVAYKVHAGFFDRSVMFLINGPIVFGWLMGLLGLFSLTLWSFSRSTIHLVCAFLFGAAVVWTGSKGPLISLALVVLSWMLARTLLNRRVLGSRFAHVSIALISVFGALVGFMEFVKDTRYEAIIRLATGELTALDEGSIGARAAMLKEGVALVLRHPLNGIGLGNWSNYSHSSHPYPHNQHLEVLVEAGAIVFLAYLFFLSIAMIGAPAGLRWAYAFTILIASFSGDISYLRFILVIALLSWTHAISIPRLRGGSRTAGEGVGPLRKRYLSPVDRAAT